MAVTHVDDDADAASSMKCIESDGSPCRATMSLGATSTRW
jgi:hypothetical protein